MFTCNTCGRQFKTKQELGGHVGHAHPQQTAATVPGGDPATPQAPESPPGSENEGTLGTAQGQPAGPDAAAEAIQDETTEACPDPEADQSVAEEIEDYLRQGVDWDTLTGSMHFSPRSVRRAMLKVSPPGQPPPKGDAPEEGKIRFPLVLKAGAGQELLSPEAMMQEVLMTDGDAGKWMMRGFMLYGAAQMAVLRNVEIMKGQADAQAKAFRPIMDIMEAARKDMDEAARRAKDSNTEIAARAASNVGGMVLEEVRGYKAALEAAGNKKVDIATTPNPIQGMMARTMETLMNQMMRQLMPGNEIGPTPGFVDMRGKQPPGTPTQTAPGMTDKRTQEGG